jgi:hypothetical protein
VSNGGDSAREPQPGETLPVNVTLPGGDRTVGRYVEPVEPTTSHPLRDLIGRRVGAYLVTRYIKHGGMGEVWEGLQESPRRPVALKVMRGGRGDQSTRRRFIDEAEIIAKLRHPNIAHVYGAGYFDDPGSAEPEPYFAMLYVPGARSLTRYAFDEGLGTEARLRLFADVCDAVAHAHAAGVVHRDLKPSNVLVDSDGHPYVIDFGIAHAAALVSSDVRHTESGQVIGTPAYLSPEQALGDPDAVDHRADIYALGVILYELICGRHPLNLEGLDTVEILRAVRRGDVVDPSTIVPDLDADLRGIMLWALARRREDRPPSAGALRDEIIRYLECRPRAAAHLTWLPRVRSGVVTMARRFPVAVRACLLAAVVMIMQIPLAWPLPGLSEVYVWFDSAIPRLSPSMPVADEGLRSVRYVTYSPGEDLIALASRAQVPIENPDDPTSWRVLHARALERLAETGARVVVLTPNYIADRHADVLVRAISAARHRGVPVWVRRPGDWRPNHVPASAAEFSPTLNRGAPSAPMVRGIGDGRVWSELAFQAPGEDAQPSMGLAAYCSLRHRAETPEIEVIEGMNLLRVRYRETAVASPGSRPRLVSTEEIRVSNVIRRNPGHAGPEGLFAIQQVFVPQITLLRNSTLTLASVLTMPLVDLREVVAGRAVFLGDPWTLPVDRREAIATPDGEWISPEWVEPLVLEQMLSVGDTIRWPTLWQTLIYFVVVGLAGCLTGWFCRAKWAVAAVVLGSTLLVMVVSVLLFRKTGMVYNPVIPVMTLAACAILSALLPKQRFPTPRPLPGVRLT